MIPKGLLAEIKKVDIDLMVIAFFVPFAGLVLCVVNLLKLRCKAIILLSVALIGYAMHLAIDYIYTINYLLLE
jgi:hypothetical protein